MAEYLGKIKGDREKYLNLNDDDILSGLTAEELNQLSLDFEDIDPDNQLLPAGYRQKNQTDKTPTGSYDREKLLEFIEEEAKQLKDEDEYVPYKPGVKRGKVFEKQAVQNSVLPAVTLDSELEECLNNATEAELTDIASILGMGSMLSTEQYYNISNETGYKSVVKCGLKADPIMEPPNQTDVDDTLQRMKNNDPTLTEVNLNNIKNIPIRVLKDYCEALKVNNQVVSFSMCNTRSNDGIAFALADMLTTNRTLKVLNIESNFMTGEGAIAILRTLESNDCLEELRFDNQRSQFGNKVEIEIADLLSKNTTLRKLGYNFSLQGPRTLASDRLTRNNDLKRRTRVDYNPSSVVTKTYVK